MAEDSSSSAHGGASARDEDLIVGSAKIAQFEIAGLFGRPLNHTIPFPPQSVNATEPELLILLGPNGCGKTTILRMIDGMLRLDFDIFRQMPFATAKLSLSTGDTLSVEARDTRDFPLFVKFNNNAAELSRNKQGYNQEQSQAIANFRRTALPILNNIRFRLVDIHRSLALQQPMAENYIRGNLADHDSDVAAYIAAQIRQKPEASKALSKLVLNFIREAQLNYRRFFVADQLELLPRILSSLSGTRQARPSELAAKVAAMKERSTIMARIGLQTDEADLDTLTELLSDERKYKDNASSRESAIWHFGVNLFLP
jgi:energy-coupling factor transporter ATP-binding protein EcfA2